MTRFLSLLLFSALTALPVGATGDEPAARARLLHAGGEVMLWSGGDAGRAVAGDPLREGDRLRTAANSRVQLRLGDDSMIYLGEHSELRLESLPASDDGERRLFLTRGIIRGLGGAQAVKLGTPLGQVEIPRSREEGVTFDCYLSTSLYCGVYTGAIIVRNQRGRLRLGGGEAHDFAVLVPATAPKGLLYRPDALLDLSSYPPAAFLGQSAPPEEPGAAELRDSEDDNGTRFPAPAPIRVEPRRAPPPSTP